MIHFDSSFVVDLLRERRRGEEGEAHKLLSTLPGTDEACVSVHAACELYVGVLLAPPSSGERERVESVLATLSVIKPDDTFPETYARLLTELQSRGTTIATMDLLIGTAAVEANAPLVTRNPKHFRPIPGLRLIEY